jgi:hypothetical protein
VAQIGRPPKSINWDVFDQLVSFQCTQDEICAFFDLDRETVNTYCLRDRGESFSDIWSKKKLFGRVRLRKAQFAIVEKGGPGSATMAIYLDKKMMPDENPNLPDPPPPSLENVPRGTPSQVQGKKSFEEFCVAAGYPAPYEKQHEMRAFAFDQKDPRLVLGARGYGKTDYLTILGVAYDVYLFGTLTTNLIITKSKPRNTAIINEIADALEANGVMLDKRNASCIRVAGHIGKDHSVEAITIKTSMRGRHPKRIIMDDPVTDEDISEAMRQTVKRKYNEAIKLVQNIVIVGQPAHAYDLYQELRPLLKKMEIPYGSIPELDHDLEAQRLAGVDEASIQASYYLKIIQDGQSPFENIKYIDDFPAGGDSVAFIDPSDGGDHTAMSIVKGYGQGVVVQGHQWKKAWYHCLDAMVPILRARGVRKVCFETNATGTQPIGQLRDLLAPHGIGVVGKHSDSNKHACIMSAGSFAHLIHLSKKSDRSYTDHVTQYEYKAKFDDAPDSLARCLEWLGLIKGKK